MTGRCFFFSCIVNILGDKLFQDKDKGEDVGLKFTVKCFYILVASSSFFFRNSYI